MTNIDNILDSEVFAQSEDAQDEENTVSAVGAPIEKATTIHFKLYLTNTHSFAEQSLGLQGYITVLYYA